MFFLIDARIQSHFYLRYFILNISKYQWRKETSTLICCRTLTNPMDLKLPVQTRKHPEINQRPRNHTYETVYHFMMCPSIRNLIYIILTRCNEWRC